MTTETVPPLGFDHRINQRYDDVNQFGFVSNYAAAAETTIAFDGTNTFTLAPTGTEWSYYRDGEKVTIVGSKTVVLDASPPADKGTYFIYIDDLLGTLTAGTTSWTLEDTKVPVAILVWDNALTPKYHLADERHTCSIPRRYHWEHHYADGTEVITNPTLDGPVVAPSSPADTDNVVGLGAAVTADEDLKISLGALTKPNGTATAYTTLYPSGASWNWALSAMPYKYGTYIQFNSAGTMTDAAGNKYVNSYLLMTNILSDGRFMWMMGDAEFSTLAAAQGEQFSALYKTGIQIAEYVAIYQFTWATSAAWGTKGKCRLAAAPRYISVSAAGVVSVVTTTWGGIGGTLSNQLDLQAALDAKIDVDGWTAFGVTMTYASATTVTIAGDYTSYFPIGAKVKLTQTTVKYFYVGAATYGAPNTTLTLVGGSDYTVANAAITLPYYSYASAPRGFPTGFAYTPALTGFSADPTGYYGRFHMAGSLATVWLYMPNAGTSNTTTIIALLPTGLKAANLSAAYYGTAHRVIDNGTNQTGAAVVTLLANKTAFTIYKNSDANAFTNSGNKRASATLTFEAG